MSLCCKNCFKKPWFKVILVLSFSLLGVLLVFLSRDPTIFLMLPGTVQEVQKIDTAHLSSSELQKEHLEERMKLAEAYFESQQAEDGNWMQHAGITAMSLSAMLNSPLEIKQKPFVQKSLAYLLGLQQENGAFYTPFSVSVGMSNYVTSCTVMALAAADQDKYQEQIKKATDYLMSVQRTEGDAAGGLGYGASGSGADLSNLHMALEAMRDAGVDTNSPFYKNALNFVSKCQDREGQSEETISATGGFAYKPSALQVPEHDLSQENSNIYGGMTYAGLDSLLLCEVEMSDPRVQDVLSWIEQNYSVETHPGKGDLSLYFYYATMAKALHLSGIKKVKTKDGDIDWARDLAYVLMKLQRKDGSWVNENPKYFEGYPVMASAYALKALNYCWRSF
jgi:squalene-hopene/tetraprenyl-beta-curcumene cyclase